MLGFPDGYIPLRVVQRDMVFYMYDPLVEGQINEPVPPGNGVNGIDDLGFVPPQRISSQYESGKPFDMFANTKKDMLYQIFWGIAPSAVRVFRNQPATTGQNNLIEYRWSNNYMAFGYVDGFESPIDNPSPNTEIILPPEMDFALGYANPLPYPVNPLLRFVINILKVEVIYDVDLISKMLDGKVPASFKTVGGLSNVEYQADRIYGIKPIPLGSPPNVIQQYVSGKVIKR